LAIATAFQRPIEPADDVRAGSARACSERAPRLVVAEMRASSLPVSERPYRTVRSAGPSGEAIVSLVRNFVIAHLGRHLGPTVLAGAAGVSESTLRRAVHVQTGKPLGYLVMTIRLDRAHAWLSTNQESRNHQEIAAALGFKSAAAFSVAYRRRFGESMGATRQRAVQQGEARAATNKARVDRVSREVKNINI
jgi:transcriptional regulator GlxA family with amidase domain